MIRRLIPVIVLVVLGACGSDDNNNGGGSGPPTISTPPPPVTVPLNGAYDLAITPAEICGMSGALYVVVVTVTTFATGSGNELRATLPSGSDELTLDMLYPMPGQLQGALSTRSFVGLPGGGQMRLRDSGVGWVSLASSGRAEVIDGTMAGDVSYSANGQSFVTCANELHSWSLIAR